jgi:tetratricopeptide (TPR) repeat protein
VLSGEVVGDRFEIERVAGAGGMGLVYRARDRLTGQRVALKTLHSEDPETRERFLREARVLADLHHPGVVSYVAHGIAGGGDLYLAMEWLEGEDLARRLSREGLTAGESLLLARRVAAALGAAHARGVVHRDVKPSNLFLPGGVVDHVKVLDFGVARALGGTSAMTRTGVVVGTPGYMSPEQVAGHHVDARADVFALGCVLFECLTGRPAFVAEHALALLAKIMVEEAPRLPEGLAPAGTSALLARMLAKEPAARPRDGAEVLVELEREGERVPETATLQARPASLTSAEQRWISVLLVRFNEPSGSSPFAATAALPTPAIHGVAARHGARAVELADGSMFLSVPGNAASDQATRAARCALALRRLLPGARMALATGRADVSVAQPVGQIIDRCARLLTVARAEEIRLDDITRGLLDTHFEVAQDDAGLSLGAERTDGARTLLGRPTKCVGREKELAALEGMHAECVADAVARAVLVVAPPGVGKSRLGREFLASVTGHGPLEIWSAGGDQLSAGSPLALVAELVRRAAAVLDDGPAAEQRGRLVARLARSLSGPELVRAGEFLGELVGLPTTEAPSPQLRAARNDARIMGDHVLAAWERWVAAECEARPLLIVIDDLHWGDLPSVKFIDAALRRLRDRPLMVVAMARPEVHALFPRLWSEREVQEIRLAGLTRRASERLIKQVLGEDVAPELVGALVERADGNAFFLEELIRASRDGGVATAPESVLAMVQARLEKLDPEARRVLRAASVFGNRFRVEAVEALLGGGGRRAQAWVDALVGEEVVERDRATPGDAAYVFRHGLVREAAYGTLTPRDREVGHRLAAVWLEARGERDALVLAEHFERGGEGVRAAQCFRAAAEQALQGSDLEGCVALAERGAGCGATGVLLGELRSVGANALAWLGDWPRSEACAEEALALLPPGNPAFYDAAAAMVFTTASSGNPSAFLKSLQALQQTEQSREPSGNEAFGVATVCTTLYFIGQREMARAFLDRLERLDEAVVAQDPGVGGWIDHARVVRATYEQRDPFLGLTLGRRSDARLGEVGDRRYTYGRQANIVALLIALGAFEEASLVAEAALAGAEREGVTIMANWLRTVLGEAQLRLGHPAEARVTLAEAVRGADSIGDFTCRGACLAFLARVDLVAGELATARERCDEASGLLMGCLTMRAAALATSARLRLQAGDLAGAREEAIEAHSLLGTSGARPQDEGWIELTYAEVLEAGGDAGGARAVVAAAATRLRALAATVWDDVLRAGMLERVEENARLLAWDARG